MNIVKKSCCLLLFIAVVMGFVGCASTAGLTESQKIGASNSPAILMSIYVSPQAEWIDLTDDSYLRMEDGQKILSELGSVKSHTIPEDLMNTSARELKAALETAGGFSFVDENVIKEALEKALEKADKKKGWNTVKSLLKGDVASVAAEKALNVAEGALVEAGKAMGIKNYPLANPSGYFPVTPVEEDFSKAAVKAAKKNKDKVKSLVYATVEFSIQPLPEVGVPTKAYCLTNIYITDEKGKLVKQVAALAASNGTPWKEFVADPAVLVSKFPMLMKDSVEHAANNLNIKTKLFEIPKLQSDSTKLVSDKPFAFHVANRDYFLEGGK